MRHEKHRTLSGIGVIEIVVGVAILVIIMVGVVSALHTYVRVGLGNSSTLKALYLAEEGVEAMRFFRDASWSANIAPLAPDTTYYLVFSPAGYLATTTATTTDGFERRFTVSPVYRRDSDKDIVATTSPAAKTIDPNTLEVAVTVRFQGGLSRTIQSYLTNLFDN